MRKPQIVQYMHCRKCLEEKPSDRSPAEWADSELGFTKEGIQIWCNRHNINLAHIHFQGSHHPAIMDEVGVFPEGEI